MASFSLQDYETVEQRLQRYLKKYPDARVITKVEHQDENRILIRAIIYQNAEELEKKLPHSTGLAEETRGEGYVNKTSHVENCETSAVGRALANAGYSGNKNGQRASREEMKKVERMTNPSPAGLSRDEKYHKLPSALRKDPIMEVTKGQSKCPECFAIGKTHAPSCSMGNSLENV